MKQTQPTLKLTALAIISIVVMGGLLAYSNAHRTALNPDLVPTKTVGADEATGGKPEPHTTKDNTAAEDKPAAEDSDGATVSNNTNPKDNAPRQTEISKNITEEYPYRALVAPNDPYYSSSWAMQNTGASTAWDISTGDSVTVAVIDTGFALQHEDLVNSWATNPGETGTTSSGGTCWTGTPADKSTNGCDDDNNGYVDDWRGWNFVNTTNNPQAGTTSSGGVDAISHGTSVAGLIGATTNNGIGVSSYNWNTKVMPLQALDDNGDGYTSSVAAAIYYAVDNGADIINMSLGGPAADPAMQTAANYAYANNVVVIAAAGNCGTTGDAGCAGYTAPRVMYPAMNQHVIAVGATNQTNTRASFSSYGPKVDVVAPGSGSIISPLIDTRNVPYNYTDAYSGSLYGTSFASPIVSGVAALIRSLRPASTVDDIVALLDATATKLPAMNGAMYTNEYGHGLVNAGTATTVAQTLAGDTSTPTLLQTGDARAEHRYSSSAAMASGCDTTASTYCAVRFSGSNSGLVRFLPYQQTSGLGSTSWSWTGAILPSDEWSTRAVQGDNQSPEYFLLGK